MGYKGVVSVDPLLDKNPGGIQMRLRESMKKFDTKDDDNAPIEIAQAFENPINCYLNRSVAAQYQSFSLSDVRAGLL